LECEAWCEGFGHFRGAHASAGFKTHSADHQCWGKESALDWFSKAIEDANELVWNLDNESSVQDQICQDSERMAEELTQKDKRKLEVWKKELRVWKLRDCCETANRGDNPRFAFHENSDKRDGTRDLGSLPEQVPDGMCG